MAKQRASLSQHTFSDPYTQPPDNNPRWIYLLNEEPLLTNGRISNTTKEVPESSSMVEQRALLQELDIEQMEDWSLCLELNFEQIDSESFIFTDTIVQDQEHEMQALEFQENLTTYTILNELPIEVPALNDIVSLNVFNVANDPNSENRVIVEANEPLNNEGGNQEGNSENRATRNLTSEPILEVSSGEEIEMLATHTRKRILEDYDTGNIQRRTRRRIDNGRVNIRTETNENTVDVMEIDDEDEQGFWLAIPYQLPSQL
ncbi:hypothetical protein PTKIN_Ptkin05aG0116000 [Pterospermum kingtungense]